MQKSSQLERIGPVRRVWSAFGNEGGQSLTEVSVFVIFFTTLLAGTAEFAQLAYTSIEVSNAARAAVAYGGQNSGAAVDTTGMQTAANDEAANLTLSPITVSTSYACSDGSTPSGSPASCTSAALETVLTVKTQATINPYVHLPGLPATYTIKGQAIQKVMQ